MDAKIYHVFAGGEDVEISPEYFVGEFYCISGAMKCASEYFEAGYHTFICNVRSGVVYTPLLGRTGEVLPIDVLNNYFYNQH